MISTVIICISLTLFDLLSYQFHILTQNSRLANKIYPIHALRSLWLRIRNFYHFLAPSKTKNIVDALARDAMPVSPFTTRPDAGPLLLSGETFSSWKGSNGYPKKSKKKGGAGSLTAKIEAARLRGPKIETNPSGSARAKPPPNTNCPRALGQAHRLPHKRRNRGCGASADGGIKL